jgi:hypothetical protein
LLLVLVVLLVRLHCLAAQAAILLLQVRLLRKALLVLAQTP